MRKLTKRLISDIWHKFRYKSVFLAFLIILSSLMEGIGLALLFPLLNLVGIGGQTQGNTISSIVLNFFNALGIVPEIKSLLFIIITIFLVQNLLFLAHAWQAALLQSDYIHLWRENLFRSYFKASWHFFIKNKTGNLINTIIGEANRLGGAFYLVFQLLSAFIITITYMSLSFYASWQITLIILVAGGIIFFITYGLVKKGYRIGKGISSFSHDIESVAHEFIGGAKVIKATSTEEAAERMFASVINELRKLSLWGSFHPNILKAIFELSSIILLCSLLYLSVTHLRVDSAVVIMIIAIFIRLLPKLFSIQQNLQLLGIYLPAIETVSNMLNEADSFAENLNIPGQKRLFEGAVDITIDNLTLSYGETQVLSGVSMRLPAGKTVGIVGSSGSGKSTLVDCIQRLINVENGTISVQGTPVHQLPLRAWRKCIGYVPQDTFLFHDTIRNNILWGMEDCGEEELIAALRSAYALDFIAALPDGYDTVVGDRGVRLSGGQRQRIGLARALVRRPSLLILDEATSALDSESEGFVMRAIDELHGRMTIVIITHRLATVRNADYIYVLESGRVVEHGTWEQLARQNERFKYLLGLQNTTH